MSTMAGGAVRAVRPGESVVVVRGVVPAKVFFMVSSRGVIAYVLFVLSRCVASVHDLPPDLGAALAVGFDLVVHGRDRVGVVGVLSLLAASRSRASLPLSSDIASRRFAMRPHFCL
jgi:hypothetical protein